MIVIVVVVVVVEFTLVTSILSGVTRTVAYNCNIVERFHSTNIQIVKLTVG